jgi:hypothetical protein
MPRGKPVTMMCTYRPKAGKEKQLWSLVKKHWAVLNKAGLTTKEPPLVYRAVDKHGGGVSFVEIFSWKDEKASAIAHQSPEVMAIWEPMGPILAGGPSPELAVVERIGG